MRSLMYKSDHDFGTYLSDIDRLPLLNQDKNLALVSQYRQTGNEEAKRSLVEGNLRLVVSIAKEYAGRGIPLPDIVQEGNLGLLEAIEKIGKYDEKKGAFITYAERWIRRSIQKTLYGTRNIRTPRDSYFKARAYRRLREKMGEEGKIPTIEDIVKALRCYDRTVFYILGPFMDAMAINSLTENDTDQASELTAAVDVFDEQKRLQLLHAVDSLKAGDRKIILIASEKYGDKGKYLEKYGLAKSTFNFRKNKLFEKLRIILSELEDAA